MYAESPGTRFLMLPPKTTTFQSSTLKENDALNRPCLDCAAYLYLRREC